MREYSDLVRVATFAQTSGSLNHLPCSFWEELGATFDKASLDGDIKAIVLASALPKAFTAGLDCMCQTNSK